MKILFINSSPPHNSLRAQEGLDALLMGSAFCECAALFIGDGVLQLVSDQQPEDAGRKDFARTFGALKDYGVTRIYCDEAALIHYKLEIKNLCIEAAVVSSDEIQALLTEHDQVVSF